MKISTRNVVVENIIPKLNKALFVLMKSPKAKIIVMVTTKDTVLIYIIAATCLESFSDLILTFLVWMAKTIPMI